MVKLPLPYLAKQHMVPKPLGHVMTDTAFLVMQTFIVKPLDFGTQLSTALPKVHVDNFFSVLKSTLIDLMFTGDTAAILFMSIVVVNSSFVY